MREKGGKGGVGKLKEQGKGDGKKKKGREEGGKGREGDRREEESRGNNFRQIIFKTPVDI